MVGAPRIAGAAALALLLGCVPFRSLTDEIPSQNTIVREQLIITSDFKLPQHHRLLEELVAQRYDLAVQLGLPTSDEPIHVYLFDEPKRFAALARERFGDLAPRRAFFVESDTRLTVYAQWGDRVAEDLRHEVAHGYLHAVVPNLPLWLDEGLAEYFEVPRGNDGLNRQHLDSLMQRAVHEGWRPNLVRLERLRSIGEMQQLDYAEAWAWIHWLLETTPQRAAILRGELHTLRQNGSAPALWTQLGPQLSDAERDLLAHLQHLAGAATAAR